MAHTFVYAEASGHTDSLDAADMAEAIEMARDLAEGGEWGDDGASVDVWVTERDGAKVVDRESITVEIDPNHEALIRRAVPQYREYCGDSPDDHKWTSEGEGGLRENPGVWSTGGTSMMFKSHCSNCGLRRTEYRCGAQKNPGEHNRVVYEMPYNDE